MSRSLRIFISVAEDSADVHAASLVREARRRIPTAGFYGLTGPRLRALGVQTVFDLSAHAAMLSGVFGIIGKALRAVAAVEHAWDAAPPDVVVLVDSPELNLRLAKKAKARGYPVLYYVAPQTWASREGRNRRIARDIDRLACILPFEEAYFRAAGVNADFVGHPLFEALSRELPSPQRIASLRSDERPLLALLPGSRKHVIDGVLPMQLRILRRIAESGVAFRPAISAVDADRVPRIRRHLEAAGMHAEIVVADNASLLSAADLVLVASGTATLHVAHYRKPMIVVYDAGPLFNWGYRWVGSRIVRTPHLSLVNILARRRLVPEFMPSVRDVNQPAAVAAQLLTDERWRALMRVGLDELVTPLEGTQASRRVCELIRELAGLPAERPGPAPAAR